MRKTLSLLLKATLSGLLLYFALNFVKLETITSRLSQIAPGWALLGLLALLAQILFATLRWQYIIIQCGGNLPYGQLFRFSMIATFFSQTLPSSVGGDAMRIWLAAKQTNWRTGTYSVFLDRVIGVVVLAALVVICLPWTLPLAQNPVGRGALVLIGTGCLAVGLVFICFSWERFRILQRWSLTRHIAGLAIIAVRILRVPWAVMPIVGASIVIQLLTAVAAWAAARSVGADLSPLYAFYIVLPVTLVTVVPISIAGWGVREGAMVMAFAYAGLSQADGFIVSILSGAGMLLLGAAGGVIWVITSERADRSAAAEIGGGK